MLWVLLYSQTLVICVALFSYLLQQCLITPVKPSHYISLSLTYLPLLFEFLCKFRNMSEQENGLREEPQWLELKLPNLLYNETVQELHTTIQSEWDSLRQSACQTAAGRALWRHVIQDPLADLLAGETYLRNFHEKIKNDCLKNAREISGVLLAVRTLWFDSKLEAALNSFNGEAQVVLLGAGWCLIFLACSL